MLTTSRCVVCLLTTHVLIAAERGSPVPTIVQSLDGNDWLLATDPKNEGRDGRWFDGPREGAKRTQVPWIIQDAFPGYHGVAWYWRDFKAPAAVHAGGRWVLRFWAVDYHAQVWLNGKLLGAHETGEAMFELDATEAIKPGEDNRLAVRVLNPTHEAIDGIVLNETPHRNKALPYASGAAWNQGGIIDSVELVHAPPVRIVDLFVRPDWRSGEVRVSVNLRNATSNAVRVQMDVELAPAAGGEPAAVARIDRELRAGDSSANVELRVPGHRLWALNEPFLYRATARLQAVDSESFDERSARFGFRDFRFENGFFRLNGRRVFLRCSHTGNCTPIGLEMPHDPDLLRRDLLNVKVMGFNAIRFISGVAKRYQLDLCDEIGLMVYEESYAGWCLADSPKMAERYDASVRGMVLRDRNHPSVVAWGMLNETNDGPVFRHAVAALSLVREHDPTRLVFLNSGGWHNTGAEALAGMLHWHLPGRPDPNVTHNPFQTPLVASFATWPPGQVALHPGASGEYSVVRWTAPEAGPCQVTARFFGPENKPTTDVHVLHGTKALFDGGLNLGNDVNSLAHTGPVEVAAGDTIDFVVGFGNGHYGADTTALTASIRSAGGQAYAPNDGFSVDRNPNGVWSYGILAPGPRPDARTFKPYPVGEVNRPIGSVSNPGSTAWENVLADQHPYQRVPHTAEIIQKLRTMNGGAHPLFMSEYGVGSGIDLVRTVRHYERAGATHAMDARFYRERLDRFMADWNAWKMEEVFGRPEDFFAASLGRMAAERLLGTSAIRSNPAVVGYSLTGTVDQGMTGEGLFTTWRELKPGTVDVMYDAWAPLRWCLFVEPVHVYRGATVRCDVVLANEDQLLPGEYAAVVRVFGPDNRRVWEKRVTITIPARDASAEPRFALPVLGEPVKIEGPPGRYRLVANLEQGAAPAGMEAVFYVADRLTSPNLGMEVVLWGEDQKLTQWCADRGIRTRPFVAEQSKREVIVTGGRPPGPPAASFAELARHAARGSVVLCLSPEVFADGSASGRWLPLARKGERRNIGAWLYHKDEWARPHAAFAGLPAGMMDYTFYRDLIPDEVWCLPETPDLVVAGANNTSQDYASGVMLSIHSFGAGRFVLNALRLRENLGTHPAADRVVLNLLEWAAKEAAGPPADLPADLPQQLRALGYE